MSRIITSGAASEVTGSCHLLETPGGRLLFDCGLFQGHAEESRVKNSSFAFDPASIKAVILSHAHLDHVGRLPLLVQRGFRGPIFCTPATRELTEQILLDAAHLQVQDAEYARRHSLTDETQRRPLYGVDQVRAAVQLFRNVQYSRIQPQPYEIIPGVSGRFLDAGHILGSMVTHLEWTESGATQSCVYTGDLGRPRMPLLRDPEFPTWPTQTLIMEATYGARLHHPIGEIDAVLTKIVTRAVEEHSKIIVPAFSLGRTQTLVYLLHRLTDRRSIPRIPIVIDSPLAGRINEVFLRHQNDYDRESLLDFPRPGDTPLIFRNLILTHTVEESKLLNKMPGPMLIISASGMLTGGRVMHHLRQILPVKENTVLITGFQAAHTPGRRLLNGAPALSIFGEDIPVRASIEVVNDLSAHADGNDLLEFVHRVPQLKRVILVHSERNRAEDCARLIHYHYPEIELIIPERNQVIELNTAPVLRSAASL